MTTEDAIETLARALAEVRGMAGCSTCECFLGVVVQAQADLKGFDSEAARTARAQFAAYVDEAAGRVRSCKHCDVCVPTGPYRSFKEALAGAGGRGREDQGE